MRSSRRARTRSRPRLSRVPTSPFEATHPPARAPTPRVIQVPGHQRWPLDVESRLPRPHGVGAIRTGNSQRQSRQRVAGRGAVGLLRRFGGHLRGRLGEAIGLQHRKANAPRSGRELRRHRAAAHQHRTQASRPGARLQRQGQGARHQTGVGDALLGQGPGRRDGIEVPMNDEGSAVHRAPHGHGQAADMEKRQVAQPLFFLGVAKVGARGGRTGEEGLHGQPGAFGVPGGA